MCTYQKIDLMFRQRWGHPGKGLLYTAQATHQKPETIEILKMPNDIAFRKKYPELYNQYFYSGHRDNRTVLEYCKDIAANWVVEDVILHLFNVDAGLNLASNGADKERSLLLVDSVTNKSDFLFISPKSGPLPIELQSSYCRCQ